MLEISTNKSAIILYRSESTLLAPTEEHHIAEVSNTDAMKEFIKRFDNKEYTSLIDPDAPPMGCQCEMCTSAELAYDKLANPYVNAYELLNISSPLDNIITPMNYFYPKVPLDLLPCPPWNSGPFIQNDVQGYPYSISGE